MAVLQGAVLETKSSKSRSTTSKKSSHSSSSSAMLSGVPEIQHVRAFVCDLRLGLRLKG